MKKTQKVIIAILLFIIGLLTTYLFYHQATGEFASDLPAHISFSLNDFNQYSITGQIYKIIYNHIGGSFGMAIFLSVVTIINIIITKKVLEHYRQSEKQFWMWIYAILLNFAIGIYLPFVCKTWAVGLQGPTKWHNSTYICMKPLGLMAILLYLKIEKEYLEKINLRDYLLFCIVLILVNSVKPNFILAFAPAMLVFLMIDFFQNIKNKKAIRNMVIFGCAVLISLPILFYQNSVLYADDSENGIAIGFMTALKMYNTHPIISLIQSAAFPLFILITNFKTIMKNRKHSFVFILNVIALAEYLFLEETGERMNHANFTWGYSFTLIVAFISAISLFSDGKEENRKKIYYIIGYGLLALHILLGFVYFGRLLVGCNYY